jgi:hypothetical protein
MKKVRISKQFLEEVSKTPVVTAVCAKLNISRQTFYRWLKEDFEFRSKFEETYKQGTDNINDLAKSKLISKISEGDWQAIKYWLDSRDKEFAKPRTYFLRQIEDKEDKVNKITVEIIKSKDEI